MIRYFKTNTDGITQEIDKMVYGCWINVIHPTQEEKEFLMDKLGIVPEFLRSSLDEEETSHLDYDADLHQTLVIVDYPAKVDSEDHFYEKNSMTYYETRPMGVIFIKGYIITISLYENPYISQLSQTMNTSLRTRFLLEMFLKISQRYLIDLRDINKSSTRIEAMLSKSMQNAELLQMLGLQKSLVYFSISLKSDELTLNKILRGKEIQLYEDDQGLLEDVMIEIHQAMEMCDIYSTIINQTMDSFSNVINNNMNDIMHRLTILTIVLSIPNMVYGFYGMNVSGLWFPFAWFPLIFSVVLCIAAWGYFKRHKGW